LGGSGLDGALFRRKSVIDDSSLAAIVNLIQVKYLKSNSALGQRQTPLPWGFANNAISGLCAFPEQSI